MYYVSRVNREPPQRQSLEEAFAKDKLTQEAGLWKREGLFVRLGREIDVQSRR